MNKNVFYTTRAICSLYDLSEETVAEMVAWGIVDPRGARPEKWSFSYHDCEQIGRVSHFSRELDINIPGAALALELQRELEKIRHRHGMTRLRLLLLNRN